MWHAFIRGFSIAAFPSPNDSYKLSHHVRITETNTDVLKEMIQCDALWLYLSRLAIRSNIGLSSLTLFAFEKCNL
jgi:hypothetical protein